MRKLLTERKAGALPIALTIMALVLLVIPVASSQDISTGDAGTSFNPTGKLRLEASLLGGGGSKKIDVFVTTTDDTITISGGGGVGLDLEAGYCLSSSIEISGAFGFQRSTLSNKVSNAEGSFSRIFLRATLKYRIPVSTSGLIKIGGGGGYYSPGDLDVDGSKVPDGHHYIFTYDASTGFHVTGEYERYISSWSALSANWSWGIGLRYYKVTYDLKSWTDDGVSTPISQLTPEFKDDLTEFDGSGFDIFGYLAMYL